MYKNNYDDTSGCYGQPGNPNNPVPEKQSGMYKSNTAQTAVSQNENTVHSKFNPSDPVAETQQEYFGKK